MGKVTIALGVITSGLFFYTDSHLFWFSVAALVVAFWSYGIIHNYAFETAKMRRDLLIEVRENNGASIDEIKRLKEMPIRIEHGDAQFVAKRLTLINLISSILIYIFFATSIYQLITY